MTDCTWEPEHHLPRLTMTEYTFPGLSNDLIEHLMRSFERMLQNTLQHNRNKFSMNFPADAYRQCFTSNNYKQQFNEDDFKGLPLSKHWNCHVSSCRDYLEVEFPISIRHKVSERHVYVKNSEPKKGEQPVCSKLMIRQRLFVSFSTKRKSFTS